MWFFFVILKKAEEIFSSFKSSALLKNNYKTILAIIRTMDQQVYENMM